MCFISLLLFDPLKTKRRLLFIEDPIRTAQ